MHSTPRKRLEVVPKWYNNRTHDDSENESLANSSFDLGMAGASTPLRTGKTPSSSAMGDMSVSFLSPMKKLNNLHLESELDFGPENPTDLGNQTLVGETETEDEYGPDSGEPDDIKTGTPLEGNDHWSKPPIYINQRKRPLDSPLDIDMETPRQAAPANTSIPNDMSICHSNSANNTFKLSFSNSDSTPCPVQPRKKTKLKFKESPSQQTPSQTRLTKVKNLLNFENSIKTSVSQNAIMNRLSAIDHHNDDELTKDDENQDEDDYFHRDSLISSPPQSSTLNTTVYSNQNNIQSTPISQSTPANSRPPTPNHSPRVPMMDEFGESINGYKFVKPDRRPQHAYYDYQTPTNKILKSQELKKSYNRSEYGSYSSEGMNNGKYKIVGDLPVTSAGLMDEAEPDLHIGDKRINDPYLHANNETPSAPNQKRIDIRNQYFQSLESSDLSQLKLPLLPMFDSNPISTDELMELINEGNPISTFYEYIKNEDEDVLALLKKERLKWHPDKWISKLRLHEPKENLIIDIRVIDSLSQSLTSIIESYKQ